MLAAKWKPTVSLTHNERTIFARVRHCRIVESEAALGCSHDLVMTSSETSKRSQFGNVFLWENF